MTDPSIIRWGDAGDGVVLLTINDPNQSANTMNAAFLASLTAAVDRLETECAKLRGVVITSAKRTFFAGGDLHGMRTLGKDSAVESAQFGRAAKTQLRRLETLGLPVVSAIAGAALGGGLEIALATHHRIVVDDPAIQLGLPEVTLGLLPGGGGVVRTVRLLGVVDALTHVLLPGTRYSPQKAENLGLVGELVPRRDDLVPAAKAWIATRPTARQPWDMPGYEIPGGTPSNPKLAAALPLLTANLRALQKGAHYPAPHHILAAAVEGAQVDFDTASEIEGRYFVDLVTGQVSKNMIRASFFDLREVKRARERPGEVPPFSPKKVLVLGAGTMGAAAAHVFAQAGVQVVLKDVSLEVASRGKQQVQDRVDDAVTSGRSTREEGDALLALIRPTADATDARGAELVIEAVSEDGAVKAKALADLERHIGRTALLASTTSTLSITELARAVPLQTNFIGLHVSRPVAEMPLLEIVKGTHTSAETVHRSLDIAKLINKTAIVVNDSAGFFAGRLIGTRIDEGIAMLLEGVPAPSIEQASSQAGYAVPVLQLAAELNPPLIRRMRHAALEAGAEGTGTGHWLRPNIAFEELKERLLMTEALEAISCLDEGVIESVAEANIGSLLGTGFPRWTGGAVQYVNGFSGGPAGFVRRARELAKSHGSRFEPPPSLVARAEQGKSY